MRSPEFRRYSTDIIQDIGLGLDADFQKELVIMWLLPFLNITAFASSRSRMCTVGVKLCNPYVVAFSLTQVLLFCFVVICQSGSTYER